MEAQPQTRIQKINEVVKAYTDHEFIYASLLTIAGIFSILVFSGPMLVGA